MKKLKTALAFLSALTFTVGASACSMELPDEVLDILQSVGIMQGPDVLESSNSSTPENNSGETDEIETITIAEALELCGEAGNVTTERYYIRATVKSITNPEYGAMIIEDETGSISVYGTYSEDGSITFKDMEEKPEKGDVVLLHCILQNYNGTKEVKNARLIEFSKGVFDETKYTEMSIAEAREAEEEELVKVSGVVAQITYANGKVPSGVYLVDETQCIYVYDRDLAGRVEVGNEVTVCASKTYWVLEKEQAAASKHGYMGCCQLEDAHVISLDDSKQAYDKSWIEESTVKDMLETPVSENITTTIFKVNALVEKRVGTGFTNYYFFDIDGETGSYTYTQCNGGDFAWVDEFSGKICTVYLSIINAKSADTGCNYRFLPIEIIDEGYEFDIANAPKFAVEYYGVKPIEAVYTGDPALSLSTQVSSLLLGFEGAQLSYESDNTDVVYFDTETPGEVIMHCGEVGTAEVTVKGTYGDYEYEETVTVKVEKPVSYDSITVAEAIDSEVDTEVTVKGIVGPSVVNKNGFYLFGEDGSMIAVLVDSTDYFVGLEIGHEVVLKGMRERYVKDDSSAIAGQTCIVNAEILVNNYGSHEYSTAQFVTDKTLADFYKLDKTVDYSTTVFVVEGVVNVEQAQYYTKLNLQSEDGSTTVTLYCSGAGQYDWLQEFAGEVITLELAACNWNDKNFWAGCALAVRTEDGKVFNELNFETY